ncbi:uncharacterized protein LOC143275302 isoform X2 [Babylonia areolata]|uniref:uncharacterized protein LOC143275302 isoform X2 n=1 Tax=Babylonia areolata TaxID=304850 RepID=UPI003FCEFB60
MLGSLVTMLLLIGSATGLQWSQKLRTDAGPVQICSGQDIQLFWNFTLDKGERLKGMVWGCQPEGKEEGVLATYVDDHFVPMSSFSGRLAHLQDGGIELSCATILESGHYSISVSTEDVHNALTVHRKTADVTVLDTPKTQSGEIHVTREKNAVRDVITGAWHVQLSCGNFSDRGHPPVDVTWTTPTGARLDSSSYEDGFFHLLLPNPLVGGNYSCSIPPSLPAARCLAEDSPLLDTVSVLVEETAGRFTLLEARQQEFVEQLAAQREMWMGDVEVMANRTDALEHRIDEAVHNSVPVHFHARLTSNTQLSSGSILKMTTVLNNQGGGYDSSTGYFTAPMDGNYFFIATTGSYSADTFANMDMMKEGSIVAKIYLERHGTYDNMGSCHAALPLKAGDRVWLQSTASSYLKAIVTSFSGFCF